MNKDKSADNEALECKDNVRFSLSDEKGYLSFKTFDIVSMPDCAELAEELRKYLLGRPLNEIDVDFIRSKECPRNVGMCIKQIAEVIQEHIEFFS